MRHCGASGGAQAGRLRDRNDGLPLGNDVKWLGVGWKGVERQRVEEESDLRSCSRCERGPGPPLLLKSSVDLGFPKMSKTASFPG